MKAAEGYDEIDKDAVFWLSFTNFLKEYQNNTSPEFNYYLAQFKSASQDS